MTIAIIIPCYKVRDKVAEVLAGIDRSVPVICVDDACPEGSGAYVQSLNLPNVTVIFNPLNLGVGGAVKAGYAYTLQHTDAQVMVKVDGDGQMPTDKINALAAAALSGEADYVKGNRFYYLRHLRGMPKRRLFGNLALSFLTKLSSGYWDVMDPTNGFTAIRREVLERLELERIDNRYFFESDMLCKLYLEHARVQEFAMPAHYADEVSSLKPLQMVVPFLCKHTKNGFKRIVYTYFVRDFNAGSLALAASLLLGVFSALYGLSNWSETLETGVARSPGTVMLTALGLIFSLQFLLFFLNVDIQNNPNMKPR